MKKFQPLFILTVTLMYVTACRQTPPNNLTTGDYTRKSELDGMMRGEAVTFTIGDTAYVGLGFEGIYWLNDFWGYNATSNSWTQEANFPGAARSSAVAFAIGTQGYVGTGYDGKNLRNDFWRYSPAAHAWDSVAPFGGSPRRDAVAFSIGNYGYVATGFDGTYQKDFWMYDPTAGRRGAWVQKASFGGQKRQSAIAFAYGTKGYVVGGSNNGQLCGDFWYYDASLDQWVQLRNIYNSNTSQTYDDNYTNIERDNGIGFVIGDSAFITTGQDAQGSLLQATWGYNFAQDLWVQRSPFEGNARQGAVGFSLNGYGYICAGESSTVYYDDLVLFNPNKAYNTNDY